MVTYHPRQACQRFLVAWALAAPLAACGGESRSARPADASAGSGALAGTGGSSSAGLGGQAGIAGDRAGSSGSVGDGGHGELDVPRLDGIPLGDCRVPTPDEHQAFGCPASPPTEGAPCNVPLVTTCAYGLSEKLDGAYQDLYMCSADAERTWWLLQEECGQLCADGGPYAFDLDAGDCAARSPSDCAVDGVFSYVPSAFARLSAVFSAVIQQCIPDLGRFSATLELEQGCPTRFSADHELAPAAIACLKQVLGTTRYACGELLPCTQAYRREATR